MGVKYMWPFLRKQGLAPNSQDKVSLSSTISKIRVNQPTDLNAAHSKFEQWLLKIGDKVKLRFYIDGMPRAEKQQTHTNCHQVRQKALIKADSAISNLEIQLAKKKRIRKLRISKANKPLQQAFHWSLESCKSFVEYMA
ncbi:hypothetical protein BGX27_001653, partial [Mortierella sp. AM989]